MAVKLKNCSKDTDTAVKKYYLSSVTKTEEVKNGDNLDYTCDDLLDDKEDVLNDNLLQDSPDENPKKRRRAGLKSLETVTVSPKRQKFAAHKVPKESFHSEKSDLLTAEDLIQELPEEMNAAESVNISDVHKHASDIKAPNAVYKKNASKNEDKRIDINIPTVQPEQKDDEDDDEEDYEVEKVLGKKGKGKSVRYLVKWKGWDDEEDQTWEPLENLQNVSDMVDEYEKSLREKLSSMKKKKDRKSSVTPEDDSVKMCQLCPRIFLTQDALAEHMETCKTTKVSVL